MLRLYTPLTFIFNYPIRVVTPFSALSAVKDRIIDERGRGGGKLNINVKGVYKRSIHSQIHKPLVTK